MKFKMVDVKEGKLPVVYLDYFFILYTSIGFNNCVLEIFTFFKFQKMFVIIFVLPYVTQYVWNIHLII